MNQLEENVKELEKLLKNQQENEFNNLIEFELQNI